MPTDKKILMKGLKYMGGALPLFFIGPVVLHSAFKNQHHPYYIPVLCVGVGMCLAGMAFMFLGLLKIMKSMTD